MLVSLLRGLWKKSGDAPGDRSAGETDNIDRAQALYDAGEVSSARGIVKGIVSRNPGNGRAHYLLGRWHGESGELEDALPHLTRAVMLSPQLIDAHLALGNVYKLRGDASHAIQSYRNALELDPHAGGAHYNLGITLKALGDNDNAVQHLKAACAASPGLADAHRELILSLVLLKRYREAEEALHVATGLHPGDPSLTACRGFLLLKTHHAQEALACLEDAARCEPGDYELHNNIGIALQELGRIEQALAAYDRSLALRPGYELARFHRALTQLGLRHFELGWPDYELRLISVGRSPMASHFPRWTGEPLQGRSILVHGEQGLGDEIMFASCYPDLLKQSGDTLLWCSAKLEKLFRRSFPRAEVQGIDLKNAAALTPARKLDLQVPAGSLPLYLRRSASDFPRHKGYLVADPARVAYWREQLEALGPGLKIGISWRGGTYETRQPRRSLPLPGWLPILRQQPARFVSLQYGEAAQALSQLATEHGIEIRHWQQAIDDYDDTAALVCALDLTISVSTAVIHLAGALGRPVWIIAPLSPEWRYGYAGDDMPWYPCARIVRQAAYGDWNPVIARVAGELRAYIAATSSK